MNQVNLYEQAIQHEILLNPGLSREEAEAVVVESPIDGFNFVMERLMKLMINLSLKQFKATIDTKYIGNRSYFEVSIFDRENTLIYQSSINYDATYYPNYSEFADKYLEELEPELKYLISLIEHDGAKYVRWIKSRKI